MMPGSPLRLLIPLLSAAALLLPELAIAADPTDTELKQAMRLPEAIASTSSLLEDAELPRQLYQLCRDNGLGDGPTAAIVDQLGWAVAEGRERAEVFEALQELVQSGMRGRELVEALAAHEWFQGGTILEENHFVEAS